MPVTCEVVPQFDVLLVKFIGEVAVSEIAEAFLTHQAAPQFDGNRHVLMDQSNCRFPNTFYDDIRNLGRNLEPHCDARTNVSRTAFFCPEDITFGMSRMYQSTVATKVPFQIEVFRTADEALHFVGIDPDAMGARDLLGKVCAPRR